MGWPFFKVVTLGEHNKREMLSKFGHGIGLLFYCVMIGVGYPLSKYSVITHNALQSQVVGLASRKHFHQAVAPLVK